MIIIHIKTLPFPRDTKNVPEEIIVKLDHCKECAYAELCSRDKVIAVVEIIRNEETRLCLEEERVALIEQLVIYAGLAETQPFMEKETSRLMILKASSQRVETKDLRHDYTTDGFEIFIIAGS